jgi:hypothetical protein
MSRTQDFLDFLEKWGLLICIVIAFIGILILVCLLPNPYPISAAINGTHAMMVAQP